MKKEIFNGVKEIIEYILRKDSRSSDIPMTKDTALRENIGLDSIDLVVLQIEVEDRWNIRFDPFQDDFQKIFCSIGTLCEFLELKIGEMNVGKER